MATDKTSSKGTTVAVSSKRKWLGRIGNFLMMGGWLLVVFLVLAIVIAVSLIGK